jgi:nucleotide-binding universal stress UspA family protein
MLVRASGHARVLILGPRGTRGAGLLGSVAREVLHHSACPTVFVHGGAIPAQRVRTSERTLTNAY